METLVRVHNTAHGAGFLTDQRSQLNISDKGDITADGFKEIEILSSMDPDPRTSGLSLKEQGLWLHLSQGGYVGGLRLMDIPDHLVDQTTAAVIICQRRLAKRAS